MTAKGARAAQADGHGEGERREAARRRRRTIVIGALFVAGMGTGFYMGYTDGAAYFEGRASVWSPTVAALLAAVYLIAIVGGSIALRGVMDEVERERSYKAGSLAGAVLMVVYPLWFLLWKGGFVVEPVHWVLFILFWLSLAGGMIWYKFR